MGYAYYSQMIPGKTIDQREREQILNVMLCKVTKDLSERTGESEKAILDSALPKAMVTGIDGP